MTLTRKEFLKYLAGSLLAVPLLGASCDTKKKKEPTEEDKRRKEHDDHWKKKTSADRVIINKARHHGKTELIRMFQMGQDTTMEKFRRV